MTATFKKSNPGETGELDLDSDRLAQLGRLVVNTCIGLWKDVHKNPVECLAVVLSVKTTEGTSTHALVNRDMFDDGTPPTNVLIEEVARVVEDYVHSLPNVLSRTAGELS